MKWTSWVTGAVVVTTIGVLGLVVQDTWQKTPQSGPLVSSPLQPTQAQAVEAAIATRPAALAVGSSLPTAEVLRPTGQTVPLAHFYQKRPALVEVFATWCPHCQHSTVLLNTLTQTWGEQVQVVGVNAGDPPGEASTTQSFAAQFDIRYPLVEARDAAFRKAFQLKSVPVTYLVDTHGIIRWSHQGSLTETQAQELTAQVKALLK